MSQEILQRYMDNLLTPNEVPSEPATPAPSLEALFAQAQESAKQSPLPEIAVDPEASSDVAPILGLQERLVEQAFQTLLFSIVGVTVAIPLVELGGIHKLSKIQFLVGKPDWFAGMMDVQGRHVKVIDGAKWILADRYNDALEAKIEAQGGYQYLILLADSDWGIACSEVHDSINVQKTQVKWRNPSAKRPWLAGLMSETMSAMLDAKQLVSMLDAGLLSTQK